MKPPTSNILVVGDAPTLRNGLGRIARDLTTILVDLWQREPRICGVYQLGMYYDGMKRFPWHVFPLRDHTNWGLDDLEPVLRTIGWPDTHTIIFTVWDPARCFPIAQRIKQFRDKGFHNQSLWGYFAVDSADVNQTLVGPVQEALKEYDRVLAYCRYGQRVLNNAWKIRRYPEQVEAIPHLVDAVFRPVPKRQAVERCIFPELKGRLEKYPDTFVVGAVAANQPRKDLALLFHSVRLLVDQGIDAVLVLVTDDLYRFWSVPTLAEIYLEEPERCFVSTGCTEEELNDLYNVCDVTFGPGMGEGFGYPIVESLAAGVPVAHVNFAGGAEFIPHRNWRLGAERVLRYEGAYATARPVLDPHTVAAQLSEIYRLRKEGGLPDRRWLSLQVEQLRHHNLTPRWMGWFRRGL